jgi:hypothetical protein
MKNSLRAKKIASGKAALASFAGISPEESGGGKKSQAKTHREACGGG